MKQSFRRHVASWFGVAAILSLVVAGALHQTLSELSRRSAWVAHTQEVLLGLRSVASLLDEAAVDARGYFLMSDERLVAQCRRAVVEIGPKLADIRRLVRDNPGQQRRLNSVSRLAVERSRAIEVLVALRRARGLEAVIAQLRDGRNESLRKQFRDEIGAMEAEEGRLLAQRERATSAAAQRSWAIFNVALVTHLVMLGLAFRYIVREMGMRSQAEATLRRSEDRFRGTFESAAVGMAVLEPDGRWLEVNAALCQALGFTAAELQARDLRKLSHPKYRDGLTEELRKLVAGETTSCLYRGRLVHASGAAVEVVLGASLARDEAGRPLHVVAQIEDVTARQRAEARLSAQHAVALVLADSAALDDVLGRVMGGIGTALDLIVGEYWQPEAGTGVLRTEARWTADGCDEAFHADSRDVSFARGEGLTGRVYVQGEPEVIEDVTRDPGFARAALARRSGLRGALGIPLVGTDGVSGVLLFLGREVLHHEEPLREALATLGRQIGLYLERRKAEEASRASDRRFRALFDNAFQFIGLLDPAGILLEGNRAALEFAGVTRSEVIGRPFWEGPWWKHSEEARERLKRAIAEAANGTAARFEAEHLGRDGQLITVDFSLKPVTDETGRVVMLLPEGHDITDRKRAAVALREAKEAAETAARLKGEFLANVSHEIRTPMNAILGMTELTLGTELNAEQRENLQIVNSAAGALLAIIDDLLDFSKIEAGRLDLDPVAFHLRAQLGDTLSLLALRAHAKGIELACQIPPELPDHLVGDPVRLRQVINNLVGNAIKFTERGEVVVEIASEPTDGEEGSVTLHFRVRDTGIGVPPEKIEAIFQPFVQADGSTTRLYGGCGLGLTISAQLVALMGGQLWVESEVGRGSTFHFTLRFATGTGLEGPAEAVSLDALQELRVLVIDDNEVNLRIVDELLRHWGARPTLADGATAGLAALEQACEAGTPFRLVLLDLQMPEMDGFALAERIQEDPSHRSPLVLMLSSTDRQGAVAHCRASGIAAYLHKPIRQAELLTALLTAIAAKPGAGPLPRPRTAPAQPAPARPLRILLAEDNPYNQRVLLLMLTRRGHAVAVVGSGGEALKTLDQHPQAYDLVLMDVQMPGMDGLETTAAIRAGEAGTGRHLPIIAMTAHARKEDRQRCLEAGMDDYISKPIDEGRLLEVIEDHRWLVRAAPPAPPPRPSTPFPPAPEECDEPMNLGAALALVDGDRAFLEEIAGLYRTEAPRLIDAIRAALAEGDLTRVGHPAHNLKNWLYNFSAPRAVAATRQLEEAARAGDLIQARAAFARLEPILARLGDAMSRLGPDAHADANAVAAAPS